jgi:hypothetical protein
VLSVSEDSREKFRWNVPFVALKLLNMVKKYGLKVDPRGHGFENSNMGVVEINID